jgi:parallel beta-helix repeat protein
VTDSNGSGFGGLFGQHNVISANAGDGIALVRSTGNVLYENRIGTNAAGTAGAGNGGAGVTIDHGGGNRVGFATFGSHSVISDNGGPGINLLDTDDNVIQNVYSGTNLAGNASLSNEWGIAIDGGTNNKIGGSAAGEGNVLSGNNVDGLNMGGTATIVEGNRIGTDAAGTTAIMNFRFGVDIAGTGGTLGGLTAGARNIVSGNGSHGVRITGDGQVLGNYIGVDASGLNPIANGESGVVIENTSGSTVGATAGGSNVISGNTEHGVMLMNGAFGNVVTANLIGVGSDGTTAAANGGNGVLLISGATGNTIGSLIPGEGNTIAQHAFEGIWIQGPTTLNNMVLGNSIYSNGGPGIETIDGGNGEHVPPVVTSGGAGGASGTSACAFCRLFVFSDDADEGRVYHGFTNTDGSGNWTFIGALTGPNVAATVEFPGGNTTEFSAPDIDLDGCSYAEETGPNPQFGGDRDPNIVWDFYDVNGDRAIDLSDTLLILSHFGEQPGHPSYDAALDRFAPDTNKPWRTAPAVGDQLGIDLQDALLNLQSFGHNCAGAP